ncbi:uncharacterized protein EDB93DRAFT_1256346 [Suillus bovinus]|uniref:uncharacterized protein n=1 Tax=Suillus bovinus TaxID=48563 RepID=UPI001B85E2E3|nr:uncharacterized protein EDB93DRAFT_1256346 [Suillus bovinus]KAG2129220.1 hypothetical protein EDB93DRAFT_1256346 [Suillus bovinus]
MSSFASTFGGLLDIKTEDSESPVELDMTGVKTEVANASKALAIVPTKKHKADNIIFISESEPEDSGEPRVSACKRPHKIVRHLTTTSPDASASPSNQMTLSATLDHFLKPRSRLPYCKAPSHHQLPEVTPNSTPPVTAVDGPVTTTINSTATTLAPILKPPGMSCSQHFFTIATSIDAHAMEISSSVEFHLFIDMRVEFAWISFKMMPKQWAVATESYNNRLEEKNCTDGHKTVRKNPQALLRKLGDIKVVVMNHIAKNNFKSCSSSEKFWRRHCHVIELIKTESGKKICKAHTCSRCKTIMYPNGAKQVSQNEPPLPWPQPPGIFSDGKRFHPRAFLETVKQIYEQVFLRPSGESPALEQEAFATMLLDQLTTLDSGTVLFKLYEELEIDTTTPDALLTVHNGAKHLHIEYLQEHWA